MLNEKEVRLGLSERQTSWHRLQAKAKDWLEEQTRKGNHPRFGHPNELAEHVVFEVYNFSKDLSDNPSSGPKLEQMLKAIRRARYAEVLDAGQQRYRSEFLPQHPEAKPFLVDHIFGSLS